MIHPRIKESFNFFSMATLCLGTRGDAESVRCLRLTDGTTVHPPYSSDITWKEGAGGVIVVTARWTERAFLKPFSTNPWRPITTEWPSSRTENTHMQCWGGLGQKEVDERDLMALLEEHKHIAGLETPTKRIWLDLLTGFEDSDEDDDSC